MFKVVPAGQQAQPNVPAQPPSQAQPVVPAQPPSNAQAAITTAAKMDKSGAPVEAAATPTASKPPDELHPRFAELARKETAIRKVATDLKAQRAQIEQERQAADARLAADPFEALAAKGWTAEKLIEAAIARGVPPPTQPAQVSPEIAALRAEIDALKKGSEKAVDTQYQAALKQIERDASKQADTSPDYPTIKARGAVSDVVELVEKHFKATGEVIPTAEAMKLVEAELIEEGLKWANLESVKAKLTPPKAAEPEATPGTPAPLEWKAKKTGMPAKIVSSSSPAKNLTHDLTPTQRPKTARERAIAIAMGQDPDA